MSKLAVNCRIGGQGRTTHESGAAMDYRNPTPTRTTARQKARDESWPDSRPLARDPNRDCRWAKLGEHPAVARRGWRSRRYSAKPGLLPYTHPTEGEGQTDFTNSACFTVHIKRKQGADSRPELPGQRWAKHQEKTRVRVSTR